MVRKWAWLRHIPRSVCCLPLLILAGCANLGPTRTGFLANYDALEQPNRPETLSYRAPDVQPGRYTGFMLEPIQYMPSAGGREKLDPHDRDSLLIAFQERLVGAFSPTYRLVYQPGPGVFRIRAAVTGVERSNAVANAMTMALVLLPVTSGGASSEMEIVDSVTGQRLAASVGVNNGGQSFLGGPFGFLSQYGHARRALGKQAEALRDLFVGQP